MMTMFLSFPAVLFKLSAANVPHLPRSLTYDRSTASTTHSAI